MQHPNLQQNENGSAGATLIVLLIVAACVAVWLSPYKQDLTAFVGKHAPQSMSFDDLPWRKTAWQKSGLENVKERFETPATSEPAANDPERHADSAPVKQEKPEKLEKTVERPAAKKHDLDKHSDKDRKSLDTLLNNL